MWRFLLYLQKNLIWVIPSTLVIGIVYGLNADASFLKQWIYPLTFLMVFPMMITLNFNQVFSRNNGLAQLLAQGINFGLLPFMALGIGLLFFKQQPHYLLGLVLAALLPTSGMTLTWTAFANGNKELAVQMTVVGLILGSFATPFYLKGLLGAAVDIQMVDTFRQIAFIIFLPMLLGYFTRQKLLKWLGEKNFGDKVPQKCSALSTLGVLGIVFVAISLKSKSLMGNFREIFYLFIPLGLLYFANYLISTLVGKYLLPKPEAIALIFGTVMRNLSIALAIAIHSFGTEVALILSLAYIVQIQSAAWYVKWLQKCWKPIKPKC